MDFEKVKWFLWMVGFEKALSKKVIESRIPTYFELRTINVSLLFCLTFLKKKWKKKEKDKSCVMTQLEIMRLTILRC